ncbi:hypothetical protein CCMA1212_008207 [Trichoderma ghanense]|uniref:SMODS and SLOG-associating 2TM effector domain-containing protein n=1 Tax=Trichoderma ghanense TaxID=65468 RepID=A0ABY2GVW1_9HYPO
MAHSTSLTHKQPPAVEKKRRWSLMLLSSMISAAVALGTMFTIAALMDPGAIGFVAGTTAAGTLWGIATKVLNNLLGSETVSFVLRRYSIQQSYRNTIEQHLGPVLRDATTSIRTNSPFERKNSVYFDVCDGYRFEDKERHMFFRYLIKVLPEPGTPPRPLDEGIPPLDLPAYDPSSTHTIEDKKPTDKGVFSGVQQSTLLGLTSGASASLMSLLLGTAGIILGVIFATMLVNHPSPSKSPEKVALFKEFTNELRCHAHRLLSCATDNNVGLELEVHVAWMPAGAWTSKSVQVKTMACVNRRLSGRVVWTDGTIERGVRRRRERKSIADGTAKSGELLG